MAAMVENGYVHGAGGSLNPKGNITRAEFAQVMDNIAESYVSQAGTVSRDASGNVIVRAPGAVLENMTVDGDVILADGVGTGDATLNSVTVQGRLIVRGGGEQSVHLNNCTIENGVVLANPNGATRLVPSGSPIPVLEVQTDAVIDGDITAITVSEEASVTVQNGTIGTLTVEADAASTAITVSDGASDSTIQANADGVSVHGGGSVGTVQANADNIGITTPGTRVTAAEGTDGVTAAGVEVAGGQTAQINNSGTGVSVSGGGSISANLKFDADLLINAKVIDKLGIENKAAQGINDRWEYDMAGWDSVWTEDGRPYDWNDYITAVNNARNEGEYLTFAEYTETAEQDQSGTPYAIKAVLEDNMLGDIQYNGEWVGQAAPALTLVNLDGSAADAVTEGNNVVLTADDGAYFSALERINVNGSSMDLSADLYQVEGNKLTIDSSALTLGERNTVTLYAKSYRANRLSILYQKNLEQNLSLSTDQNNYDRGENIVITVNNSEGVFFEHLTNVTLHKPGGNTATVNTQGVQSNTEYYTVSGNILTIVDTQGTLLNENGQYSVALEAEYYNRLTTPAFTVQGDLKAAPQPEMGSKDSNGNYTLTFASAPSDWENGLSVTVNGQAYTENTDWLSNVSAGEFEWSTGAYGGDVLTMHPSAFASGENTITLSAAGYEPLTVKVSGETGAIMTYCGGTEEPESEPGEDQTPPAVAKVNKVTGYETYYRVSFEGDAAAYLSALEAGKAAVTVNDETCEKAFMFLGGKQYKISDDPYGEPAYLDFSEECFSTDGNAVVKISVEGYTNLTFTVDKDGQLVTGDTPEDAAEVPAYEWEYNSFSMFAGHKLYFDRTGNAEDVAQEYLSAVTNVQVEETVYTACTGYFLEDGQYKIVKDGTDKYIELSDSAFSKTGTTEIHIKAADYKDLKLTVTASGDLVTDVTK